MWRKIFVLALVPLAALAEPTTYELDASKTELLAFTEPTGLFKGASHSHLIQAKQVVGKVIYDPDAVNKSWVTVSFPVEALVVDEPALRKREGMTTIPNEKDRSEVGKSMRSDRQLDSNKYPQISFDSTEVKKLGDGKLEITGKFAMRGVKKEFKVPVSVSVKGDEFRGEGTLTITHKDFGMEPFVAVLGTVRNAEPIKLKLLLVGKAKGGENPSGARP